ncbi:Periplasmic thiol:disulfide oxidoreductase DsbB, required for DsbA reoxidation [Rhodovulum sp. P5]|uniref:disulfide bond formation protein B n=1 Tax=Rhodovulum sp. P5 TaxID=1564506 RepID=UPI0009C25231|nr:disulfide bond formation protein B [Rhodovulum sp. P5]ARE38317.1 Periplasmic thiol:disulfide oxidoreductase DsbB, required for DsbA reoxidation [Rhodovulum sp. P5]
MTPSRTLMILLAAAGSLGILLGAFAFQYLGGLDPCEMCLWQRWPHAVALGLAIGAIAVGGRLLTLAGTLTMLVSTGLGVFHTGVERRWWPGPASCTGEAGGMAALTPEQMLNPALVEPVVMCDVVAWQMFGLSMASYNALASAIFAMLWARAAILSRR